MQNSPYILENSLLFTKVNVVLFIWKFLIYVLLKPSLKDFEHNLASMWNKPNCTEGWTFFGILWPGLWKESYGKPRQNINKQSDNMWPCTPFSILNQSVVPCLLLTVAFWPAYRFLRRQIRWCCIPIFKNFPVCCDPEWKVLA